MFQAQSNVSLYSMPLSILQQYLQKAEYSFEFGGCC